MPNTHDNLKEAFAGESQAFQKYTSFAEAAEKEGRPNIARLFRTTAQAGRIHAAGHFQAPGGDGGKDDAGIEGLDGAGGVGGGQADEEGEGLEGGGGGVAGSILKAGAQAQ